MNVVEETRSSHAELKGQQASEYEVPTGKSSSRDFYDKYSAFGTVDSLAEFMEWINRQQQFLDNINNRLPKDNQVTLYFRGVSDSKYDNIPSINRSNYCEEEDVIFHECLCRCPEDFSADKSAFEKLVRMQHYGVPTRLLDITSNPLVALYFACEIENNQKQKARGKVCAFYVSQKAIKYSDSDTVSAVANLALCPFDGTTTFFGIDDEVTFYKSMIDETLSTQLSKVGTTGHMQFFNETLSIARLHRFIRNEKPSFEPCLSRETVESVWAVKPMQTNARIARQSGLFLIFGLFGDKKGNLQIPPVTGMETVAKIKRLLTAPFVSGQITEQEYRTARKYFRMVGFPDTDSDFLLKPFTRVEKRVPPVDIEQDKRCDDVTARGMTFHYSCKYLIAQLTAKCLSFYRSISMFDMMMSAFKKTTSLPQSAEELKSDIDKLRAALRANRFLLNHRKLAVAILCDQPFICHDAVSIIRKTKIRKEIEPLGMSRDRLFPELPDVAEYLKEIYRKET